jgi:hypothetical protein
MGINMAHSLEFRTFRANNNLEQQDQFGDGPALLQLPPEMLTKVGQFVATGNSIEEAGKNAVQFEKVCTYTTLVVENDREIKQKFETFREDLKANRCFYKCIVYPLLAWGAYGVLLSVTGLTMHAIDYVTGNNFTGNF